MTLDDIGAVKAEETSTEKLKELVEILVAENEQIKEYFQVLLDRQDRVGEIWGRFIQELNGRVQNQQNNDNSI